MFEPPHALHRTYDEWPFFVSYDSLLLYDTEGNVSSYLESDVYRRDMEFLSAAQAEGLLRIDPSRWDEGEIFAGLGSYIHDTSEEGAFTIAQFAPEKANFRMVPEIGNHICISDGANVPLALSVLEAVYTRPEVYQAFVYGARGVDWEIDDAGNYRPLSEEGWMNGGYSSDLSDPAFSLRPEGEGENLRADPATLIDFPAPLFTPTTDIYDKLLSSVAYVGAQGVMAARCGIAKADIYFEPSLNTLIGLGLQDYVLKAQEQYTAFLAK
jgi:hypothetical protein